jgi:hypothetical protein
MFPLNCSALGEGSEESTCSGLGGQHHLHQTRWLPSRTWDFPELLGIFGPLSVSPTWCTICL